MEQNTGNKESSSDNIQQTSTRPEHVPITNVTRFKIFYRPAKLNYISLEEFNNLYNNNSTPNNKTGDYKNKKSN